jgi:hypothetical protein
MKNRLLTISTLLLLLSAPSLFAGHYADLYVIPVASHTAGVGGTNWRSDIAVHNFGATPLTLELVLIESGESTINNVLSLSEVTPVVVPPNGSRILGDVLARQEGGDRVGAVVIGGNRPFAVTSRSYSMSPAGDTVGQTVLAERDFVTNALGEVDANATAYIPGLISNDRFRTNLGFAAAAGPGGALVFDVTLRDASGTNIGTKRFTVPPGAFMHQQFSSRSIATNAFDAGAAQLRIVSGNGAIVPYASVIDNATADAVFVSGEFPPVTTTISSSLSSSRSLFGQLLTHFSVSGALFGASE